MEETMGRSMEETHADAIIGSSNPNLGITETTVSASEILKHYSLGYRFTPLDQELITGYLQPKINNLPLPTNLMHEVDIYLHTPEYLTVNYEAQGDKIWYFFTPRDKKYKNGSRPNRRAEDGYWKATGADKTIKTDDGQEIGFRKALVYYRGNAPKGVKTSWIMHEFRVNGPSLSVSQKRKRDMLLDYVLCRIYQNDESGKKKSRRKPKTEPVVLDEEGNNSSAEEEANNSNDTTSTNANANADTANNNGNINQPSNDNMTGYDNKHNINQPSNNVMTTVYNFNQLMNNTITDYVEPKINQLSYNTMTGYHRRNNIGYNGFAQGYNMNNTNQDVSSMQNYALNSSSCSKLIYGVDDGLSRFLCPPSTLEPRMQAFLSSYFLGDHTHNFTATTDQQQQQQQQQPPQLPFPSNNFNPAAPTQDMKQNPKMYPRSAPVSYKMIPTPR